MTVLGEEHGGRRAHGEREARGTADGAHERRARHRVRLRRGAWGAAAMTLAQALDHLLAGEPPEEVERDEDEERSELRGEARDGKRRRHNYADERAKDQRARSRKPQLRHR